MEFSEEVSRYFIKEEPYYHPQGKEIEEFERAYKLKQPVMLMGPTGCGKTRFVEHMAYRLQLPLVTTACNEDTDSSDLTGRFVLKGQDGVWIDGRLTLPVRYGGIGYLDEIVEARQDVLVLIHSLTDTRRELHIPKSGETLSAPDNFMLTISYNPGYQSINKDLKQSTRQRFIGLNFTYPKPEIEQEIVMKESGVGKADAKKLVALAGQIRSLQVKGLEEGASTRLLIYAGQQVTAGTSIKRACQIAMRNPITNERMLTEAIDKYIKDYFK